MEGRMLTTPPSFVRHGGGGELERPSLTHHPVPWPPCPGGCPPSVPCCPQKGRCPPRG